MALRALTGVNLRKVIGADDKTVFEGATVQVNRKSDGALVTLYTDKAGTTTSLNPFAADNTGTFLVWVAADTYEVSITAGDSLGTLTFDLSPRDLESIAHVNDFLPGAASVAAAIESACTNAETVLFGGTALVFDSTVTISSSMVCTRIDLQGATLTSSDNAQFIVEQNNFIIENGVYDGGLKETFISTQSDSWPSTLTVDDPGVFGVGDFLTSSWSNRYLSNSATSTLGLNTVAGVVGNVITLTIPIEPTPDHTVTTDASPVTFSKDDVVYQSTSGKYYIANVSGTSSVSMTKVEDGFTIPDTDYFRWSAATLSATAAKTVSQTPSIIPQNARLFNARFDLSNVRFTGTGLYSVKNMTFQNCANAYYIDVADSTESARISIKDCNFNSIALDMFKFQCDTVIFDNCFCDSPRDIGKQGVVWANNTKLGNISIINGCEMRNGTRDTPFFVFPTGVTCYWPNTYIENSTINGEPAFTSFIPNQLYNYAPSLSMLSFFGPDIGTSGQTAQNVVVGDFTAVNCKFPGYQRAVLGTTFTNFITSGVTFTQGKIKFSNCAIGATPVDVRSGGGTVSVESIVIDNCNIKFCGGITVPFMGGIREFNIRNSKIQDNYPETGGITQTGSVTGQEIFRNQIVNNTATGKNYICVSGSSSGYTAGVNSSLGDDTKFLEITSTVDNGVFENTIIEDRLEFGGNDIFWNKARFNRIGPITPDFTESNDTTTSDYSVGDTVENTQTRDIWYCNTASTTGDLLSGGKFALTNSNKPTIQNFQQGKLFGSAVLLGADATDATELDLKEWLAFNISPDNVVEADLPIIDFYVDNTSALIEYGGDEDVTAQIGLSKDYRFQFKGLRSDASKGYTAPLNYRGAFLYNPPPNSVVTYARDNTAKRIVSSGAVTIGAGTSGTDTITTTAVTGTPNKGDWLSLNENGSNQTYFHEITAASGTTPNFTLTVRPDLYFTADSADNSQLIKSDWIYGAPMGTVELVQNSGSQVLDTSAWDAIEFDTERQNDITYANSTLGSGTITLPRGKYQFSASVAFKQRAGDTSATLRTSIRLVSTGGEFTTFKSASCTDRTDDTLASSSTLTTRNHIDGVFQLNDEDTVRVDAYSTQDANTASADSNNYAAVLQLTRIG